MAEPSRNSSRVWITLLILLSAAALIYYALPGRRERITVRTASVARQTLIDTVPTNGRVEPLVDFQVHAPMASVIEALPVKLGQTISKGQELVRLSAADAQSKIAAAQSSLTSSQNSLRNMQSGGTQDELLAEQSDLNTAEAQIKEDDRSIASLQALLAKGAASSNELTSAQHKRDIDQLRVQQLQTRLHGRYGSTDLTTQRAQVAEAKSSLAAAQSAYAALDVHSPIAGTVYSLPYTRFDFVQAGDALVNIADLNRLQVRAYFDEPDIGKLKAGQPVTIFWDAKPNLTWHGHVTQAPTTVITYNGTRNVGVCLISVDDAKGDLIPNSSVTVRVTTSEHFNILSIPREALRTEGNNNFVFRVINNRLVKTPVTIREGDVNLTRVGVSGGLQQGEIVALAATTDVDLADGMRVKPQS